MSARLMRSVLFAALTLTTVLPAVVLAATPEPAAAGFVRVEPRVTANLDQAGASADGTVSDAAALSVEAGTSGTVSQPAPQDPVTRALDRTERDLEAARAEAQALLVSNQRLGELNAELRQEIESLAVELQAVRATGERRAWLYAGGLVIVGLLLGRLLATRRRSNAWS